MSSISNLSVVLLVLPVSLFTLQNFKLNSAREIVSKLTGPNGDIDWLNCGVTKSGWRPPKITIDNIIIQDIDSDGVFAPCKRFLWMFEEHAKENGLHPTMLVSTAMQESGCNPETIGGAGEQGLMQLTKDKCRGAPGGNCRDPVSISHMISEREIHRSIVFQYRPRGSILEVPAGRD